MKIVLCSSGYPPVVRGGGEISSALLAQGLTELGIDVTVLTFAGQCARERRDGVDVLRLPCPNVYWSMHSEQASLIDKARWHLAQSVRPTPPASIRSAIEELKPDLIHTSTIEDFGPSLWRWAAADGFKTVHTLRSYFLLHHKSTLYDPSADQDLAPDLLSYAKRRFANSVDAVVGISNHILQTHLKHKFFASADRRVIGNPSDSEISVAQASLNGPVRLGVLGRIAPEKGIGELIKALHTVHDVPRWSLQIAGEGSSSLVRDLQNHVRGLPVTFCGWQNSRDFLANLDLLLVPSRWQEPFGRIVVEAYSLGLPVACLRRGGLPELVVTKQSGWVFDEWTPESLGFAIRRCRGMNRADIRKIAKIYTKQRVATEYARLYQSLLSAIPAKTAG